ncbi:aspartate kinase [Parabacteroides sp. PFB2-10]|uniref:aspartate kinase n=1 Tax=Parabacteroides sp. PFB2-10 TaxID=1742405 RepID=UPI002476C56C|nr:aspartate kinase [Parabacteroides sp. PFB2-10]MDH6312715.1 aspartate kinase [Parabacteroides sp. PFB2-10]
MKVLKFGGTSVGSAQRIQDVAKLIAGERNIVVLSAMSGTTNSLVEISDYLYKKNPDGANEIINRLAMKYYDHVEALYRTPEYKQKAKELIKTHFDHIRTFTKDIFTLFEERVILAQGELISTGMMNLYLQEQGINSVLLPALDYMRTDKNAEPDPVYIKEKLSKLLEENKNADLFITQGYICRNAYGEIDNLQRGGSDYTASLIGAAISSEEIQIWTDIDGMHNNDPRIVDKTAPVRNLHFEEAAELAYFGAKILHPTCILPAKLNNIPVRLLNTIEPEAPGTLISNATEKGKIKAVAAKENITAIKIKSGRMLLATGFLRKVFEIFENYQTPIDMVTTSEVGVSVTIDNRKHLEEIIDDLKKFGTVTVDSDMVIVCVVGDMDWENIGFEASIVQALKNIPVRMISYGGSNYNVSLLIKADDKKKALQALSDHLFNGPTNLPQGEA